MGKLEEITAAQDAWRDAKRAYDDEAAQYVGVAWLPSVARLGPVDGVTRDACEKLIRLPPFSRLSTRRTDSTRARISGTETPRGREGLSRGDMSKVARADVSP
jgi:hypothetical protein